MANRVDIDERLSVVDEKERIVDGEDDSVCGMHYRGFLVTLVERKSKYTFIGHVPQKKAALVGAEVIRLLKYDIRIILTIAFDNCREFTG